MLRAVPTVCPKRGRPWMRARRARERGVLLRRRSRRTRGPRNPSSHRRSPSSRRSSSPHRPGPPPTASHSSSPLLRAKQRPTQRPMTPPSQAARRLSIGARRTGTARFRWRRNFARRRRTRRRGCGSAWRSSKAAWRAPSANGARTTRRTVLLWKRSVWRVSTSSVSCRPSRASLPNSPPSGSPSSTSCPLWSCASKRP